MGTSKGFFQLIYTRPEQDLAIKLLFKGKGWTLYSKALSEDSLHFEDLAAFVQFTLSETLNGTQAHTDVELDNPDNAKRTSSDNYCADNYEQRNKWSDEKNIEHDKNEAKTENNGHETNNMDYMVVKTEALDPSEDSQEDIQQDNNETKTKNNEHETNCMDYVVVKTEPEDSHEDSQQDKYETNTENNEHETSCMDYFVVKTEVVDPSEDSQEEVMDPSEGRTNYEVTKVGEQSRPQKAARFAEVNDEQLLKFSQLKHAYGTKINTRWGIKLFQEWHSSTFGHSLDMMDVQPAVLAEKLSKFYCEARQQDPKATVDNNQYHINSLHNIRSAINRQLKDLGRTTDIVKDKEFIMSNRVLSSMFKSMTACGLYNKPSRHNTEPIDPSEDSQEDIQQDKNETKTENNVHETNYMDYVVVKTEPIDLSEDSQEDIEQDKNDNKIENNEHETHDMDYVVVKTEVMDSSEDSQEVMDPSKGRTNYEVTKVGEQSRPQKAARFAEVDDEQLLKFSQFEHANSTKRNTRWGIKLFQEWHSSTFGHSLDMMDVEPAVLAEKLSKFYCEARQQDPKATVDINHYHKSTLHNIRAAINRQLKDLGRTTDIVRDKEFIISNRVLSSMLKSMTASGLFKPTKHKAIIPDSDLLKIKSYFGSARTSPIVLRQCVWYQLTIHFCTRGLDFHHQLTKKSFEFLADESGKQYVKLTHETCQKNSQDGLQSDKAQNDIRMYATGGINCPLEMLRLLIKMTHPKAQFLFNSIIPKAISNPKCIGCWYDDKRLSKRTFANFLPDISEASHCDGRYTAHCLRATSIAKMNDAGFEARQIMFMSGHRHESSIRSYKYTTGLSTNLKQGLSKSLSTMTAGVASGNHSSGFSTEKN